MPGSDVNRRFTVLSGSSLDRELQAFLVDREARGLSPHTLGWYRQKLPFIRARFVDLASLRDLTAPLIRAYLVELAHTGHSPGGVKSFYQILKTLLLWYESEYEPRDWFNPIRKVPAPRVPEQLLEPVRLAELQALLATCERHTFAGERDRALLLFLLDTGCRRAEVVALNVDDVDIVTGAILIRQGKGRKPRVTFISAKTKRLLLAYLRQRPEPTPPSPLWVTDEGGRLTKNGLYEIVRRRAAAAGIKNPGLHAFRRAFALASLRGGMDVYSLQRLMGHADLSVLRRYLAQTEADLQAAHERAGPVDHLL